MSVFVSLHRHVCWHSSFLRADIVSLASWYTYTQFPPLLALRLQSSEISSASQLIWSPIDNTLSASSTISTKGPLQKWNYVHWSWLSCLCLALQNQASMFWDQEMIQHNDDYHMLPLRRIAQHSRGGAARVTPAQPAVWVSGSDRTTVQKCRSRISIKPVRYLLAGVVV